MAGLRDRMNLVRQMQEAGAGAVAPGGSSPEMALDPDGYLASHRYNAKFSPEELAMHYLNQLAGIKPEAGAPRVTRPADTETRRFDASPMEAVRRRRNGPITAPADLEASPAENQQQFQSRGDKARYMMEPERNDRMEDAAERRSARGGGGGGPSTEQELETVQNAMMGGGSNDTRRPGFNGPSDAELEALAAKTKAGEEWTDREWAIYDRLKEEGLEPSSDIMWKLRRAGVFEYAEPTDWEDQSDDGVRLGD